MVPGRRRAGGCLGDEWHEGDLQVGPHSPWKPSKPLEKAALQRLRRICARLPEAVETETFGHPTFQAGKKKTFVVLDDHERPGALCIVVKASIEEQRRLVRDARFVPCKFGAKHGWTSMVVDRANDWEQVETLVVGSYRRVALKRMVAALDADRAATRPSSGR